MKKLIVLVAALLLVGMIAMADATVSGKVEYRAKNDMTDEVFTQAGVVELKIDGMVDDNTSVYVELEEDPKPNGYNTAGEFGLERAHITVDVGAALDLPVGVTVNGGFNELKTKDGIKVTKGEYEDGLGTGYDAWGYQIEVVPSADFDVTLRTSFGNDWDTEEFLIGLYGSYDPVTAEVFYAVDTDREDGIIEGGAEFGMEVADGIMLGVAATAKYDLGDVATGASELFYGAGVDVDYMEGLGRLGIALRGESEVALGALVIYLSTAPAEGLEAFLSIALAMDVAYATDETIDDVTLLPNNTPEDGLDSVDFGLSYALGGATVYAGYQYSVEGGDIAKEWSELAATGEEGAIYLRLKAEY